MFQAIRIDRACLRAALMGVVLAGAAVSLSACNTVEGAGKDVSGAGHATTNAATAVQQKM